MLNSKELKAYIEKHNLQNVFADQSSILLRNAQFQAQGRQDGDPSYRRRMRTVAGTTHPTSSGIIFCTETTLPEISKQAAAGNGVPILINHDTGSFLGGGEPVVPIGRTTGGEYNSDAEKSFIDFFIDDDPKAPESGKVLSAIDDNRMTDVSIGGQGKFMCNFCETRMGYFGCSEGHLPLMQIMLDKNGKETYDREEAVDTFTIYAVFQMKELIELSMAWKGAIPGAEITDKYSEYEHHIQHVFGDNQLFTFSDLSGAYFRKPVQKSPESTNPQPQTGGPPVSTPTHDYEVLYKQADADRNENKKLLEAANAKLAEYQPKVDGFDKLQAQFDSLKTKYSELEKQVENIDAIKVQGEQFDTYVNQMREDLKTLKNEQVNVSEDEKRKFSDDVDKMTDVSLMARLLNEMRSKTESNGQFLKRIGAVTPESHEVHNDSFLEQEQRRVLAGY